MTEEKETDMSEQDEVEAARRKAIREGLVVAIDPGKRDTGVAVFWKKTLYACGLARAGSGRQGIVQLSDMIEATVRKVEQFAYDIPEQWEDGVLTVDHLVIERMETRKGREDVHSDLIDLSILLGGIQALIKWERCTDLSPRWTRGRKKAGTQRMVDKTLRPYEQDLLAHGLLGVPKSNFKEVYDAVGMGLTQIERMR